MLRTRLLAHPRRETPASATCASHALLLRACLFRAGTASGLYEALPLGWRVLDRLTRLVAREMDHELLAQRCDMPVLMAPDLWQRTGRYEAAREEMLRLTDRRGSPLLLAPTHEEAFTDAVGAVVGGGGVPRRVLPVLAYQIGRKFRDEARPRGGLLRGREFLMKDMYSYHASEACAARTYAAVCDAYDRILRRAAPPGARIARVLADSGSMGGAVSHEFHVVSAAGEDTLLACDAGDFAANVEAATLPARAAPLPADETELQDGWILVPRGRRASRVRLDKAGHTRASVSGGVLDASAAGFVEARHGDACTAPGCSCKGAGRLRESRGIEVGHSFRLGTRYTEALGLRPAPGAPGQKPQEPLEMSCFGLGITRIVAAVVEADGGRDEHGIVWSDALAPFRAVVVPAPRVSPDQAAPAFRAFAERLGVDGALLDDRFDGATTFSAKLQEARLLGVSNVVVVRGDGAFEVMPRVCGVTDNAVRVGTLAEALEAVGSGVA